MSNFPSVFVPVKKGMNTVQKIYRIYNFTLTVGPYILPHCLVKLKIHQQKPEL